MDKTERGRVLEEGNDPINDQRSLFLSRKFNGTNKKTVRDFTSFQE